MSQRALASALLCLLTLLPASPAAAQDVLDRVVRNDPSNQAVEITGVTTQDVGALAAAADVPMGLERLPGPPFQVGRRRVPVTGRTLREALHVMMELDAGYEWREIGGVVVIRPAGAWDDAENPLHAPAPRLTLRQISVRTALHAAAALLGSSADAVASLADTKSFALETEPGPILDVLNATVRAHGEITWTFYPNERQTDSRFAYFVGFMRGTDGVGIGVPGRPPINVAVLGKLVEAADRRNTRPDAVLDRIVGADRFGYPLVSTRLGPWEVEALAIAVGVPMGIEVAESRRHDGPQVTLTGLALRDALHVLTALDPRYEWREMDGVIVFRTPAAWRDSYSLLFTLVPPLQLENVPAPEAVDAVLATIGGKNKLWSGPPDTRRVSLDVPSGTALDLLNALLQAHGELVWRLGPAAADAQAATGLRRELAIDTFNGPGRAAGVE